jgi:hypothetical protein
MKRVHGHPVSDITNLLALRSHLGCAGCSGTIVREAAAGCVLFRQAVSREDANDSCRTDTF